MFVYTIYIRANACARAARLVVGDVGDIVADNEDDAAAAEDGDGRGRSSCTRVQGKAFL